MTKIICPHCGEEFNSHSAFVAAREAAQTGEIDYQPDPTKSYKSPEFVRKAQLAYYYLNRDKVLARMKSQRQALKREQARQILKTKPSNRKKS
jgi:hypothetical protein